MSLRALRAMSRPGMRAYFIPLGAGLVLTVSAFLPWVHVAGVSLPGVPETAALWIAGLGVLASVFATLSLVTRKNSRHPLLVVGLVALGIMVLAWRIAPQTAGARARTISQALAIVEDVPMPESAPAVAGSGIFVGLASASVIAAFGLTIVVKRASRPYAEAIAADDDV